MNSSNQQFIDSTIPEDVQNVRVTDFVPLAYLLKNDGSAFTLGERGTPQIITTFNGENNEFEIIYINPTCMANEMGDVKRIAIEGRLNKHEAGEYHLEQYVNISAIKIGKDLNIFATLTQAQELLGQMTHWWNKEQERYAPIQQEKVKSALKGLNKD
ncbi:MAG: hypothetical protein ACPG05_04135 [Bdellovibrionales bacterium]